MKKTSYFQKIKHHYSSLPYSEYEKIKKRFARYGEKIKDLHQIDPGYETYAYFRGLSEGRISINEQVRSAFLGRIPEKKEFEYFTAEVRTENFIRKHPEMGDALARLKAGKITSEEFYKELDAFKKTRTYANRGGS